MTLQKEKLIEQIVAVSHSLILDITILQLALHALWVRMALDFMERTQVQVRSSVRTIPLSADLDMGSPIMAIKAAKGVIDV